MFPYIRKPPNHIKQQAFTLSVFGGGMNNVSGDTTINDNEATDCNNMMFISDEIMEKRYGISAVDDLVLTKPITWVDTFKPINESVIHIRATDTEVYAGTTKIADVSGRVRGTNYIGKYYFVDQDKLRMYDGSKVYEVKEDPKTIAISDVAVEAELPINIPVEWLDDRTKVGGFIQHETSMGINKYEITGVNVEDNIVTINTTLAEAIEEGDFIRLYVPRAKELFFEGQVKYDETLNYTWYEPCDYELDDSYKGENYLPVNPSVMCIRGERFYLSGDLQNPHNIYMSEIANPLYFPSYLGFQCPPNGDMVVDILEFDNALIVARHNDMFAIYGNSASFTTGNAFNMKKIDAHIGFMAPNCFAVMNNFLFYLGYDGKFYRMNTPNTYIEYLMTKPLKDTVDLYRTPISLTSEDMKNISSVSYDNEFIININDKTLVYSYTNQAFTYYEGWKARSLYTDGLDLYIGTEGGVLALWDKSVYSDLGIPYESVYETKRFDFNSPINYKNFLQCLVTAHAYDDFTSSVLLQFEVDFYYKNNAPIIYNKHVVNSNLSNFNVTAPEKLSAAKNIIKSEWIPLNYKGRTIKFKFSNSMLNEPMRVYDINMIYTARDVR